MKFVLPLPPNLGNARMHWRTKNRKKREYAMACLARYGKLPRRTFTRATISAHLYVHQYMDHDNAMARLKWPVDFLVNREFIADDNRKILTWVGLPEQTIDRKNPRLEIELTELVEEVA